MNTTLKKNNHKRQISGKRWLWLKDCVTKIRMNEAMNKTEQAHIDVPTGITETWPKLQGTYPATQLAQGAEYQYLKVTMS
jgi:hypothetical protein